MLVEMPSEIERDFGWHVDAAMNNTRSAKG